MKTFELLIKLRATEGHRTHRAAYESESMDTMMIHLNQQLGGKFFAVKAYAGGTLTVRTDYVVIINTAEVQEIMIDEVEV